MLLNIDPPKPIKCKHCGYVRGQHKAGTFQCPVKGSRGRFVGITHFLETVYEPKVPKQAKESPAMAEPSTVKLPELPEHTCPKCGGINGYEYELTETHAMSGSWGMASEAGDSGRNVKRSRVRCVDCRQAFSFAALCRKGLAA